ncbi:dihydrodipicolinate synthase family protein, partial [Arthrospira platensis SPKY1]|nr:dihydrodipicolinate synthase family protein [Arthrospira platensis SPKY1]
EFSVFSGNDDEILSLMATGAEGVISVASNIDPETVSILVENIRQGNINISASIHHKLSPLFKACFVESNPIPVKEALSQMGLIQNILRPPLYKANGSTAGIMAETLKSLKLI